MFMEHKVVKSQNSTNNSKQKNSRDADLLKSHFAPETYLQQTNEVKVHYG